MTGERRPGPADAARAVLLEREPPWEPSFGADPARAMEIYLEHLEAKDCARNTGKRIDRLERRVADLEAGGRL